MNNQTLYRELMQFEEDNAKLKAVFARFHKNAVYELAHTDNPVKGITVGPLIAAVTFDVSFCGKTWQFRFRYPGQTAEARQGVIECLRPDDFDPSEVPIVARYTFDRFGAIEGVGDSPNRAETLHIEMGGSVLRIVMLTLFNSLRRAPALPSDKP
jgi:hypothetical protein